MTLDENFWCCRSMCVCVCVFRSMSFIWRWGTHTCPITVIHSAAVKSHRRRSQLLTPGRIVVFFSKYLLLLIIFIDLFSFMIKCFIQIQFNYFFFQLLFLPYKWTIFTFKNRNFDFFDLTDYYYWFIFIYD